MGCDIHWYSETRRDGQWVCDQAASFNEEDGYFDMSNFPDRARDYWFFGLLNQVRTSWPWEFPEYQGALADVSPEIAKLKEQWDSDAHSHGVRTRAELKAKLDELKLVQAQQLIAPPDSRNELEAVPWFIAKLEQVIHNLNTDVPDEDQRIVFWFDN